MVECDLAKVEVASSNLVSRSKYQVERRRAKGETLSQTFALRLSTFSFSSGRRSQVVRQRSAKPLFIGSIPIAASINLFIFSTWHLLGKLLQTG